MATKKDRSDLVRQLEEGIARLTSSDAWERYLVFQSRFHRYSFGNVLLIAAQNEGASHVAGFHTWRRLERAVRKGEKAIWILAPLMGATSKGDDERVMRGFRSVPVFDISQTDGADVPAVCRKLSGGDPARLYDRLLAVATTMGFTVEDHVFADGTNGDCCPARRRIRVETSNAPAQRVKTLAHELAHAVLHQRPDDRNLAELEAESVAYVVCGEIGLDTGSYSFGYVAGWAGGGDKALVAIKTSCARIQKAAASILEAVQEDQQCAA
jgi:antirestriction protein ArdC